MRRALFKTVAMVAAGIILIQLVPVERTNPPVTAELTASSQVMGVLEESCYDCHSNETRWPWYSKVAPIAWVISKHVREGRENLNFSDWQSMSDEDKADAMEEVWEVVEKGAMPLRGYLKWHPSAVLSSEDLSILEAWSKAVGSRFSGPEGGG